MMMANRFSGGRSAGGDAGFMPNESSMMGALAAGILALVGRQRRP